MTALERLLLVRCPALETPGEEAGGEETGGEEEGRGRRLRLFARVVDALTEVCPWIDAVRPGVCTLPIKGPVRYFGSEAAVLERVRETVLGVLDRPGVPGGPAATGGSAATGGPAATGGSAATGGPVVRLGVAEGLFAATLAASVEAVVPAGGTARFLAPWPVAVLEDAALADVLVRLGLTTLGRFADVPSASVLARFGTAGGRCHRVARGLDGDLPGHRVPGMAARLVAALGRDLALTEHQPGFWGGASAADERAAEVLTGLQRRLGPEAVAVPVLDGGRGPGDRCRLVPWRPPGASLDGERSGRGDGRTDDLPWPGRLPPPAPARVLSGERPTAAEVVDGGGAPVAVTGRGLLTGRPARLSVAGGPWRPITGWSAPWPVEERWWSRARRRAARLQVLTAAGTTTGDDPAGGVAGGRAYLLVLERGRWRVEAAYD
jgi:protein ImuB